MTEGTHAGLLLGKEEGKGRRTGRIPAGGNVSWLSGRRRKKKEKEEEAWALLFQHLEKGRKGTACPCVLSLMALAYEKGVSLLLSIKGRHGGGAWGKSSIYTLSRDRHGRQEKALSTQPSMPGGGGGGQSSGA